MILVFKLKVKRMLTKKVEKQRIIHDILHIKKQFDKVLINCVIYKHKPMKKTTSDNFDLSGKASG